MKNHFVFELKLVWVGIYRNLLAWIPTIYIFIKTESPSITFRWVGIELSLWYGFIKNIGKLIYITPNIILIKLDKIYKERYDFQFFWFGIEYRKFIGKRRQYQTSLVEELKKPLKFEKPKVYVVTRSEEHCDYAEVVFSNKQNAEKYCESFNNNEDCYARDITEVELEF